MDIQERFSVVLKVSKMVKWSRVFVRSIRGLPNFLVIPIMNPLTRVHDKMIIGNLYTTKTRSYGWFDAEVQSETQRRKKNGNIFKYMEEAIFITCLDDWHHQSWKIKCYSLY